MDFKVMAAVVAVLSKHLSLRRLSRFQAVLNGRVRDTVLVFENLGDSHNIAACLRTADALGVQDGALLITISLTLDPPANFVQSMQWWSPFEFVCHVFSSYHREVERSVFSLLFHVKGIFKMANTSPTHLSEDMSRRSSSRRVRSMRDGSWYRCYSDGASSCRMRANTMQ